MTGVPAFSDRILACLKSPGGGNDDILALEEDAIVDTGSGRRFPFIRGIPSLYHPSSDGSEELTSRVRSFYEENPFPSYEGVEEFANLVTKGQQNPFTMSLLGAIGFNKTVLGWLDRQGL